MCDCINLTCPHPVTPSPSRRPCRSAPCGCPIPPPSHPTPNPAMMEPPTPARLRARPNARLHHRRPPLLPDPPHPARHRPARPLYRRQEISASCGSKTADGLHGWGECYTQSDRDIQITAHLEAMRRYIVGLGRGSDQALDRRQSTTTSATAAGAMDPLLRRLGRRAGHVGPGRASRAGRARPPAARRRRPRPPARLRQRLGQDGRPRRAPGPRPRDGRSWLHRAQVRPPSPAAGAATSA